MPRQTSKPHVEALEALIALAQQDEDEWVSLLGAVLVGYPRTGQLAYDALPLLRTAEVPWLGLGSTLARVRVYPDPDPDPDP